MRVKFLYPPRIYGVRELCTPPIHPHIVPLGLPMLVSYLRQRGVKADQDDLDIRNFHYWHKNSRKFLDLSPLLNKDRIKSALKGKDDELSSIAERCLRMTRIRGYDAVGFSLIDQFNLPELGTALLMAKMLKEKHGTFVMLGGAAISSIIHSDLLEECSFIDASLTGSHSNACNLLSILDEQEPSQEMLRRRGLDSQRVSLDSVRQFRTASKPGLLRFANPMSKKGRCLAVNPDTKQHSITDILPLPDFRGLPLDLYRFVPEDLASKRAHKMLILSYRYTVGCPFNCAFCSSPGRGQLAHKEPSMIADELEYLSKKHNTRFFFFLNSACNPSKGFTNQVCDEFIRRDLNLQWSDCADFRMMTADLPHKLRLAGAVRLIFGLESGSERIQRYVNKNLNLRKVEKLLRISHKCGIWNEVEVITGFPHETWDDVLATERFLCKNHKILNHFYLNMFYLAKTSLMHSQPSTFRIMNLRKDPHGEGLAFDEIGRDSWEQSLQRKKKSFDYLFSLRNRLYNTGYYGFEGPFLKLFYLYFRYGDKEKVANHMEKCSYTYSIEKLGEPGSAEESYNTLYFKKSHKQKSTSSCDD